VLLILIYAAFTAGWADMMAHVVAQARLTMPPDAGAAATTLAPPSAGAQRDAFGPGSFGLLRFFFPGISQYFLVFVWGGLLQLAAMAGVAGAAWAVLQWLGMGTPAVLQKLWQPGLTPEQLEAALFKLSPAALAELETFFAVLLAALAAYGLFSLVTMFWMPWAVLHQSNAWQAYGQSVRLFFKDPLRLLLVGMLYALGSYVVTWLLQAEPGLMGAFWQFLALALFQFFSLWLFLYVADKSPWQAQAWLHPPRPEVPQDQDEAASTGAPAP
jgi:hypothetical protein